MASNNVNTNIKAGIYTLLIIGLLITLFMFLSWSTPAPKELKIDQGLEVNLGDSETGLGETQPLIPEKPASTEIEKESLPPNTSSSSEPEKEIETNDDDKDAPSVAVKKSSIISKQKTPVKIPNEPIIKKNTVEEKPVQSPPSPPAIPKVLYKSPTNLGKGGNNGENYQNATGQGVNGGIGDQGKLGGDPNSNNYSGSGGSGNGGVSISRGLQGRKINKFPSFEDDFKENAKVAVDVVVDERGNVTSATFQQKGSTTANSTIIGIALKKARQLKFSAENDALREQMGTIIFNFRIKN